MFSNFFFLLRAHGIPVSLLEWLNLIEALSLGMAQSSLLDFYSLARSILVKSEAYYDQYDQAFGEAFGGIETPAEIAKEVWEWLADPLAKEDMPPDKLDLEGTIDATAGQAGMLSLVWTHERRNTVKVLLLMDAGGSMHTHSRLCSRLFTAVNRASHFKDLRTYYFHNCVYDHLYHDPTCHPRNSVSTAQVLQELTPDYKLVM